MAILTLMAGASAQDLAPDKWTLVGPFDNVLKGFDRTGLDKDYLGGEAAARPPKGKSVKGRLVDFTLHYSPSDNKVAYAFGTIKSPKAQTLTALFGSDDGAKVWLNGQVVHRIAAGRALVPEQDAFPVALKAGDNSILVKVENGMGGWGFALTIPTPAEAKKREVAKARLDLGTREIVPRGQQGFGRILGGPDFPALEFRDRLFLEPILGPSLSVRWFSEEAKEVTRAEKPGLYFAWVEAEASTGQKFNRLLTFVMPDPLTGSALDGPVLTQLFASPGAAAPHPALEPNWKLAKSFLAEVAAGSLTETLFQQEEGAWLVRSMGGFKPRPAEEGGWQAAIAELQLKVKMAALGVKAKKLSRPQNSAGTAPVLHEGSDVSAGMKAGTSEKVKALLAEWSKEEGKPFSAVIARRGVAFVHEGFGVEADATFYPASIGKTLFGLVFAQFVDQGLVKPDQHIGDFLKDWPKSGPDAMTFRHLVTHASGIAGHGTYGGWSNPTLDSAFALRADTLKPGRLFEYGGDGNNIAAKALELISGKPISQLMQEQLFAPLEAKIVQPDGGWSSVATAWDIAKVGQMMANRGRYGATIFLSEKGFSDFLPTRLLDKMPNYGSKDQDWGFAVSWMPDPDGPRKDGALGPNVIGHGSASSSILRVDLDSGIVVVMGRYGIGKEDKYNEYRVKLMKLLRESLVN